MKKIYMTMVAMLCGAAAMAQTCTISVPEAINLTAGEQFDLEFLINQDGTSVNGMGTIIEFPDKIAPIWDEEEEMYVLSSPAAKGGHKVMLEKGSGSKYTLAVASTGSTFRTTTNVIAIIGIRAEKDIVDDVYEIKVGPTSFNIGTTSVYPQDEIMVIKATVTGGTAINSINAADSKAPVYNLAGQRVSKAQKGVFIQNGKKVAVK